MEAKERSGKQICLLFRLVQMICKYRIAPPSSVGDFPSSVGAFPSSVGAFPSNVGALPTSVGTLPTSVGALPTSVGDFPTDNFIKKYCFWEWEYGYFCLHLCCLGYIRGDFFFSVACCHQSYHHNEGGNDYYLNN